MKRWSAKANWSFGHLWLENKIFRFIVCDGHCLRWIIQKSCWLHRILPTSCNWLKNRFSNQNKENYQFIRISKWFIFLHRMFITAKKRQLHTFKWFTENIFCVKKGSTFYWVLYCFILHQRFYCHQHGRKGKRNIGLYLKHWLRTNVFKDRRQYESPQVNNEWEKNQCKVTKF